MKRNFVIGILMVLMMAFALAIFAGPGRGSEIGNGRASRSHEKHRDEQAGFAGNSAHSVQNSVPSLQAGETAKIQAVFSVVRPIRATGCAATLSSMEIRELGLYAEQCALRKIDELNYLVEVTHRFSADWATRKYSLSGISIDHVEGVESAYVNGPEFEVVNMADKPVTLIDANLSQGAVAPEQEFLLVVMLKSTRLLDSAHLTLETTYLDRSSSSEFVMPEEVYLWSDPSKVEQELVGDTLTLTIPLYVSAQSEGLKKIAFKGIDFRSQSMQEARLEFNQPLAIQVLGASGVH